MPFFISMDVSTGFQLFRKVTKSIFIKSSGKIRFFQNLYSQLTSRPYRDYRNWINKNEPTKADLLKMKEESIHFIYQPKISIITPVWNTPDLWLREAIESVLAQTYDNWELCIAEGGSTRPGVRKVLEHYSRQDERIKITFLEENKGISENSNQALLRADGEFIALLDHDDLLAPFALYEIVKQLNQNPELDYIYSDEDKIDPTGRRCMVFFKPDWSPDLLLTCGYTNHLSVYRKKLVVDLGGFRDEFEPSQDYDLLLRCTEAIPPERICHIDKVLYHWRISPGSSSLDPWAQNGRIIASAKKALKEAISRRGIKGDVQDGLLPTFYRIKREIVGYPKVSIIIPIKDKIDLLKKCLESLRLKTTYRNYEIIIVDNNSSEPNTLQYLSGLEEKIIPYPDEFNFSKINNLASSRAEGACLVFLNNDTEILSPDWLESLLEQSQRPEVGAVGCKLLYPNRSIQHAGVILRMSPDQETGVAGHIFNNLPECDPGYFGLANSLRNYSAVTGAAMMVRRTVFEQVGGFEEKLSVCYNDVDFCLRLREKGYLIVYTPYAELIHKESITRGTKVNREEALYMLSRWGKLIKKDPYYNSNLRLDSFHCALKK